MRENLALKPNRVLQFVIALCLTTTAVLARSENPSVVTKTDKPIWTSTSRLVNVTHTTLDIRVGFDLFTQHFESLLGRYDPSVSKLFATDPSAAEARLVQMEGEQGLMIFTVQNHGALLALAGGPGHAKRYHVGNPRIALQMTKHDIRTGLYAPLSLMVYEPTPGLVRVEFDEPSTLLGQFDNADVAVVGHALDGKLLTVITHAAQLAARPH